MTRNLLCFALPLLLGSLVRLDSPSSPLALLTTLCAAAWRSAARMLPTSDAGRQHVGAGASLAQPHHQSTGTEEAGDARVQWVEQGAEGAVGLAVLALLVSCLRISYRSFES
jgi:hypothetical protein